jgi:hypothetical protein
MSAPDTRQPIFDPGMDVATVVFSHVQCVGTRRRLAQVSKLWRDASRPAAAYPLRFDFDFEFPHLHSALRTPQIIAMMDNDEALSLPYERVVGLLGEAAEQYGTRMVKLVCDYAAELGSVRLLKWARENNLHWSTQTCCCAANKGHLPALKYLHENGCPWDWDTSMYAAAHKHWDCLQYAVDNKCRMWEDYAEHYAEHLR